MILGLPWLSWLLLLVAVVPGLIIVVRFRSRGRDARRETSVHRWRPE